MKPESNLIEPTCRIAGDWPWDGRNTRLSVSIPEFPRIEPLCMIAIMYDWCNLLAISISMISVDKYPKHNVTFPRQIPWGWLHPLLSAVSIIWHNRSSPRSALSSRVRLPQVVPNLLLGANSNSYSLPVLFNTTQMLWQKLSTKT